MLMSKSRLEKFLYALYSLDSSDLPTPLSRIEELYKCWVTGEKVPTFEPLSRVEKYLMAILGVYDVNELPNPLSRVEILLYKLATGDDNLDDIKSFLSEHEELLAEIIRNGGVGGNIDIEYVLYTLSTEFNTLYNTEEKPVKSAILKGNTMVNIAQITSHNFESSRTPVQDLNKSLETGKQYTIIVNIVSQTVERGLTMRFAKDNDSFTIIKIINGVGLHKLLYNATNDFDQFAPYIILEEWEAGLRLEYNQLMIIEGDYTNIDIPYFEGMQSVKMPVLKTTGKNLFNRIMLDNKTISSTGDIVNNTSFAISEKINVKSNATIIYSNQYSYYGTSIHEFGDGDVYIKKTDVNRANQPITTSDKTTYVIFLIYKNEQSGGISLENFSKNAMLEEGAIATAYEPYKSNILSTPADLELRGIGDVKDELDLVTGEVTQRIGEVVFDGSEDWVVSAHENSTMFYTSFNNLVHKVDYLNSMSCDKLVVHSNESYLINSTSPNGISAYADWAGAYPNENWIYIKYADSEGYVEKLKQWLSQNPITVQYELTTPVAKTVDISVVNQDGNNTELGTFDDLTHVILSSEGLIPEAELEVATKNEEVLNTMSLEMDDISATQTTLEETSNTQSENVDATMIATTEIYEQLL